MNHVSKTLGKNSAIKSEEQAYTFPLGDKERNSYQTQLSHIVMSMKHEVLQSCCIFPIFLSKNIHLTSGEVLPV